MEIKDYHVIGLMSGTSLDGMDLVYVHFSYKNEWNFDIKAAQTFPYSREWVSTLQTIITKSRKEIEQCESEFVALIAATIKTFCAKYALKNIDAVCSHGHTLFHEPEKGLTFQMGNQPQLAQLLGLPVVCDFRKQDVNYGGQGAPLVPIGDALLFKKFSSCLNLGGFANVSYSKNKKTIAFDIGAVNTVLNLLAQQLNKPFDVGGKLARSGQCITPLMARLNAIDFYQKKPPKSLGIEWVNAVVMPLLVEFNTSKTEDLLTTYTLHIAKQIGQQFKKEDTVLVTGGGAKNTYLLECIKKNSEAQFILPEDEIIDFKEALIFGFLGVLRLRNEINCLASVTGASKDHSSGTIFYP